MLEKKYKCLKCNAVFGVWGKKTGRYGGFIDCCPHCGNDKMKYVKRNFGFGFGWTKLRIGFVGVLILIIGFGLCLDIAYAYLGLALISVGFIISTFAIMIKSE